MSKQSTLSQGRLNSLPAPTPMINPKSLVGNDDSFSDCEGEVADENCATSICPVGSSSLHKASLSSERRTCAGTARRAPSALSGRDPGFLKMSFDERQRSWKLQQKAREESIALVMLTEEQVECTFAPQVKCSPDSSSQSRRTLKRFLKDQEKFTETRAAKVKEETARQRQRELKEMREAPQIDPKSSQLATDTKSSAAGCHERLYSMEKENRGNATTRCTEESVSARQQRSREQQTRDEDCVRSKISRELTKVCTECNGNTSDKISYATLCMNRSI